MVHFLQNHLYKFIRRSRGFLPRTSGAERIRGYKIVKEMVHIVFHCLTNKSSQRNNAHGSRNKCYNQFLDQYGGLFIQNGRQIDFCTRVNNRKLTHHACIFMFQ